MSDECKRDELLENSDEAVMDALLREYARAGTGDDEAFIADVEAAIGAEEELSRTVDPSAGETRSTTIPWWRMAALFCLFVGGTFGLLRWLIERETGKSDQMVQTAETEVGVLRKDAQEAEALRAQVKDVRGPEGVRDRVKLADDTNSPGSLGAPKDFGQIAENREVVVSHADEKGILQLYRMNEDGSESQQLTHSEHGCRMPACSPDGKKLIYTEQVDHSLSLWISDVDGKNARSLVGEGMNLIPSWLSDSRHIVWMKALPGKDPSANSQIHLMNTETGESRRLFSDPEQLKFSNSMPAVSPKGDLIAFVSNRSGEMRIWVSALDGRNARLVSPPEVEFHEAIEAPIEQKVPAWSPDGKWIAHWEGVEMVHMSKFTGVPNPQRDRLISETFHVWVVGSDGKNRRKIGRGDDPTWSPNGFVTRAFPDPKRGGPKVMIETNSGEKELPIVPSRRNWGRFTWLPGRAEKSESEQGGTDSPIGLLPLASRLCLVEREAADLTFTFQGEVGAGTLQVTAESARSGGRAAEFLKIGNKFKQHPSFKVVGFQKRIDKNDQGFNVDESVLDVEDARGGEVRRYSLQKGVPFKLPTNSGTFRDQLDSGRGDFTLKVKDTFKLKEENPPRNYKLIHIQDDGAKIQVLPAGEIFDVPKCAVMHRESNRESGVGAGDRNTSYRVVEVNKDWGFVVLRVPKSSAVKVGSNLMVVRDGNPIANLRVATMEESGKVLANIVERTLAEGERILPGDVVLPR